MNIFYVTSFITEKVSQRVIEEEELEEYLFISSPRYDTKSEKSVSSEKIYKIKKPIKSNLVENWSSIIRGNRKLSRLCKDKFDLYVPNTKITNVNIIMSHKKCGEFSFIEEGFTSYCNFDSIKKPTVKAERKIKNYIAYLGVEVEKEMFEEGYKKAYGISNYSFPKWERKKVIEPKFSKGNTKFDISKKSCILVLDSMRTISERKQKIYLSCLSRVVSIMENKYEKVYYKLHPDNYDGIEEVVFGSTIENSECIAEEIDKHVPIEEFAIRSGLDVIVNLSSTGLYCILYSIGALI